MGAFFPTTVLPMHADGARGNCERGAHAILSLNKQSGHFIKRLMHGLRSRSTRNQFRLYSSEQSRAVTMATCSDVVCRVCLRVAAGGEISPVLRKSKNGPIPLQLSLINTSHGQVVEGGLGGPSADRPVANEQNKHPTNKTVKTTIVESTKPKVGGRNY